MKIQYTINLYDRSDYLNIINATVKVQQAMEMDPKIGLFTNFHSAFVAVGLLYGDWSEEKPKAFDPFTNLTSLMTAVAPTTNGTLSSLSGAMAHLQEPQKYLIYCRSSLFILVLMIKQENHRLGDYKGFYRPLC